MRFGSVCSGIEAASVAWHSLGWKAAWLSEIEPFPIAVLAHHYPDVPNLGDMTLLPERILSGEVEAPDVFCGGTPCQAFSVAGLRHSLGDARGNLSLTFCEIANAIDTVRHVRGEQPSIVFWENVPGVLSTRDNAFGCFLAQLCGGTEPLVAPSGWTNAGCVSGPKRTVAWRVLDAQYFGVAQRRKRVFVVASARNDFDPAAVLFEFDGVRRDTAPSRETGKTIAPCVTNGPPFSRTGNERVEAEAMVVQPAYAIQGSMIGRNDSAGPKGDGINEEVCFTQNTIDRHAVFQPIALQDVTTREKAQNGRGWNDDGTAYTVDTHATQGVAQPIPIDTMNMTPGHSSGGLGFGQPGDPSFTLTKGHSHAVAQPMVLMDQGGSVMNIEHDMVGTLRRETHGHEPVVMQPIIGGVDYENNAHGPEDVTGPLLKGSPTGGGRPLPAIALQSMAVRRLTPVECERLQGFPDNYTNILWRKKEDSPDGPRYKALGNSWAVPNVRWIGQRIQNQLAGMP
jgi:DNA (cytosine-5)-methyltransferase 1